MTAGVCVAGVLGSVDVPPGVTDGFGTGSGVGPAAGAFDPAVGGAIVVVWGVAVFGVGCSVGGTFTVRGRVSCGVGGGGFVDCVCAEAGTSKIAISNSIEMITVFRFGIALPSTVRRHLLQPASSKIRAKRPRLSMIKVLKF